LKAQKNLVSHSCNQLRGRVGRGSDQSFCILLTGNKISNEARERLKILCATNDGFKVAEKDLEIRGPVRLKEQNKVAL
jgi:ATP-dependent DNA helicase RecG